VCRATTQSGQSGITPKTPCSALATAPATLHPDRSAPIISNALLVLQRMHMPAALLHVTSWTLHAAPLPIPHVCSYQYQAPKSSQHKAFNTRLPFKAAMMQRSSMLCNSPWLEYKFMLTLAIEVHENTCNHRFMLTFAIHLRTDTCNTPSC